MPSSPLGLMYLDVWLPAHTSVGGHKYCVSFIDDFGKFTWLYLLKKKSDVARIFIQFQTNVVSFTNVECESSINEFLVFNMTRVVCTRNYTLSSPKFVLTLTSKMELLNENTNTLLK